MFKKWKKNTLYISLMQLTLLFVNFILITLISREYGAEIYGEYASAKSLAVLLGTATVLSLALVVTQLLARNDIDSPSLQSNAYLIIVRNSSLVIFLLVPLSMLFYRDTIMTILFFLAFVINELIHIALGFFQSHGDFVTSSKQILLRTVLYGVGVYIIIANKLSIYNVIIFQILLLLIFFVVAIKSIPKFEIELFGKKSKQVFKKLEGSGRKMVLTTFSSALISELDILLLGLFYSGPMLGVLAWSRRILEIIFQLIAASLDILFPELSKNNKKENVINIRKQLRKFLLFTFSVPILFLIFRDVADKIFISILGNEFTNLSRYTAQLLFCLPLMIWSRINIIFSRSLNFEASLTKMIAVGTFLSIMSYYVIHFINFNPAIVSIFISQFIFAIISNYSFKKSYV
jgi:O-antigen/teichoic acid export membrane protein